MAKKPKAANCTPIIHTQMANQPIQENAAPSGGCGILTMYRCSDERELINAAVYRETSPPRWTHCFGRRLLVILAAAARIKREMQLGRTQIIMHASEPTDAFPVIPRLRSGLSRPALPGGHGEHDGWSDRKTAFSYDGRHGPAFPSIESCFGIVPQH